MKVVDASLVRGLLQAQFPEIDTARVAYLNEGCDNVAFEVDESLVFRFPKRADVEGQIAVERAVLETLRSANPPVAIPDLRFNGRPTAVFPFHFSGYSKIPGQPGIRVARSVGQVLDMAPVLSRFLSWLHDVPLDSVVGAGLGVHDMTARLDEVRRETLEEFPKVETAAPWAPLARWRSWIEESNVPDDAESRMVLLHNDFAAEHVLVGETDGLVTGVIDWSDVSIGDRAIDFAGICHWGGERLMGAVLDAYHGPLDAGLQQRARFMAACRGVLDVSFGVEHQRQEYIEAGLQALTLNAGA